MRYFILAGFSALAMFGCNRPATTPAPATTPPPSVVTDRASDAPDADNTAINERDAMADTKTPIDQNENQTDIDITANIRRQIVDTKMSINAQNVKVITQAGKVTLRGPVESAEEKSRIEEIAKKVAGDTNVDSQLEIEQ